MLVSYVTLRVSTLRTELWGFNLLQGPRSILQLYLATVAQCKRTALVFSDGIGTPRLV